RDLDKLEAYLEAPSPTTIFVVSYKDKKLDGRTTMAKTLKKKAEVLTTKKLYDNQLPEWTSQLVQSKDYTIEPKALSLLVDHIGNDLSRLNNEIEKLLINLGKRKKITEDDIEKYVGVSKEYNPFELQSALVKRDLAKAIRIIQYFEANPKAAPIQLILPTLYNLFSKAYQVFGLSSQDEKTVAAHLGVNPFFVKDYLATARQYGFEGIESALLLLHHYNLKSVGIADPGSSDASLLKEMMVKIIAGNLQ
ncbi:MAG: DNA polymerase III subunit delta, partial [Chitinophagaceae bacterium]